MSGTGDKEPLTDEARASVRNSGALANLRQVSFDNKARVNKNGPEDLKHQAETMIENIQQLLDSGKLDDGTTKKLSDALTKLRSALAKDSVSKADIATALSEAANAVTGVESKSMSAQQKAEKLWQRVEADNKDIDDDFTKMQQAGFVFNQSLLDRHKELMEYLQTHPRDIGKQKELDAVDDALLLQAESQTGQHPDGKADFDDAKKKSDDRHQLVDKALGTVAQNASVTAADFDDDNQVSAGDLTLNDVKSPSIGQKSKSGENKFVHKQTNVCFRIKPNVNQRLYASRKIRNRLIFSKLNNDKSWGFFRSDGEFCSKVNVGLLHNGFV